MDANYDESTESLVHAIIMIKQSCSRHEFLYHVYFIGFFSLKRFFFRSLMCCYITGWNDFAAFFLVLRTHFIRSISLHSCLSQNVKLFSVKSMTSWRYHFPMLSNSSVQNIFIGTCKWLAVFPCLTVTHNDVLTHYVCQFSYSSNSISLCDCYSCQQLSKCFGVILDFRSADDLPWIVQ